MADRVITAVEGLFIAGLLIAGGVLAHWVGLPIWIGVVVAVTGLLCFWAYLKDSR